MCLVLFQAYTVTFTYLMYCRPLIHINYELPQRMLLRLGGLVEERSSFSWPPNCC